MVRCLRIDIPHQRRAIAQSNGKNRIPLLPTELREFRPLCLDPLRRRDLQPLNYFRNRLGSCNKQYDVNVIRNSTHANANVVRAIENRSQVRMHLASNRIAQPRPPLLRTEHQMHQNVRERLRHGCEYSAGLQPAYVLPDPYLGLCPRLPIARTVGPQDTSTRAEGTCHLIFRRTPYSIATPDDHRAPTRGLKARATLAWGEAPGDRPSHMLRAEGPR